VINPYVVSVFCIHCAIMDTESTYYTVFLERNGMVNVPKLLQLDVLMYW